jgi:hypothetical protein
VRSFVGSVRSSLRSCVGFKGADATTTRGKFES